MEDYYDTTKKKTIDFFKGFFLNIGIGVLHFGLYWLVAWIISTIRIEDNFAVTLTFSILLLAVIIVVEFFLIRHFFKTRRFIAIGMLSSLILPLLVTGFCSIAFNALSGGF